MVEHLYRGLTWGFASHSDPFIKDRRGQTIEFACEAYARSGEDRYLYGTLHVVNYSSKCSV